MRTIHFRQYTSSFYSSVKTVGATVLGGLWALASIKTVGATVLGGLWALERAWQSTETNLRCVRSSGLGSLLKQTCAA